MTIRHIWGNMLEITEITGISDLTRITGADTSNGGVYGKRNLNDP